MCQFFSFLSDAKGNYYFADSELRKEIKQKKVQSWFENSDSHSSLAKHFFKNGAEDRLNAYEFNPITKVFTKDKINIEDDSQDAETWVNNLNFKKIVPELIIKDIVNPFKLKKVEKVSEKDIKLLKKWNSVMDSVVNSVGYSVWNSNSVGNSVVDSVMDSVGYSVVGSVMGSVRNSVWNSVRNSVWNSVEDSVYTYISSFFDIKYRYDFSSCVELWNKGLVPSFDGETWRLHSGEKAEIVFEISKENLKKY